MNVNIDIPQDLEIKKHLIAIIPKTDNPRDALALMSLVYFKNHYGDNFFTYIGTDTKASADNKYIIFSTINMQEPIKIRSIVQLDDLYGKDETMDIKISTSKSCGDLNALTLRISGTIDLERGRLNLWN